MPRVRLRGPFRRTSPEARYGEVRTRRRGRDGTSRGEPARRGLNHGIVGLLYRDEPKLSILSRGSRPCAIGTYYISYKRIPP